MLHLRTMRADFFAGARERKIGAAVVAVAVVAWLAVIGFWMLFSNLALYDDEGYVLLSAREYFSHGHLYETVYTQYGPAFYVMTDALQGMFGPVDNTGARLLTLTFWLGTAVGCGAWVQRQTRSSLLALGTLTTTFFYLYFITDEPFHPGSSVILILTLSLCALTELIAGARLKIAAAVAGCAGALLLLTKINVGIFYVAATVAWAVLHAVPARWRKVSAVMVVVVLALLAAALMHTLWRETWVQVYLVLFATGAITLVAAIPCETLVSPKQGAIFAVAGAVTGGAVLAAVWLRGTSLAGLLNGVFLGPLRHPSNYSYPVDWRPGSLCVAGLSLVMAAAHPWIRRRFSDFAADRLIVALRLLVAAGLLLGFALLMQARVIGAIFSYVAPLIWIWVIPLSGGQTPRAIHASRALLSLVLLVQYLHAYPVGGSQESWGTFLFWPLTALGLGEIYLWQSNRRTPFSAGANRAWPVVAGFVLLILLLKMGWTTETAHSRYASRIDLGLPGASHLRLPESQRTAYQLLALNAAAHADLLFSLPGMFSFNLWTDLPTPTEKNTTLWFTLLNDDEQAAIIRSIEAKPRTCLIVQESLVELMAAGNVPMRGILHDYLRQNFGRAFRVEGFSFMIRKGRTIAPLGIGSIRALRPSSAVQVRGKTQFEFCFASDGSAIHQIEVHDLASPHSLPTQVLDAKNTRASIATINSANRAMGEPIAAAWPIRFKGIARLSLEFDCTDPTPTPTTTIFHLIGSGGYLLGVARVGE